MSVAFTLSRHGSITLDFGNGIRLVDLELGILLEDGTYLSLDKPTECVAIEGAVSLVWRNDLSMTVIVNKEAAGFRLIPMVSNRGDEPVRIRAVNVFRDARIESRHPLDRALLNGEDMNTCSGIVDLSVDRHSSGVVGLTNAQSRVALVLGMLEVATAFTSFDIAVEEGKAHRISASVAREGISLQPGDVIPISPMIIRAGSSLSELMTLYARESGKVMEARHTPMHTGWCSWYTYYGTETVEDVLANVESFRTSSLADKLKTIQIDDGWNYVSPDTPRNWGDWEAGYKFPAGMKDTADRIKAAGFGAGLWLAPFSIDPGSRFFREHPDLLVQDGTQPKLFWECYGLDLTNPRAIEYVRETFDRVFNQWGFDYIKIDFLLHAIQPGRRHDESLTTAEVLRRGLQAIRDVAGPDRFILTCGCPMGPAVGICDAMRIGLDVSHRWYLPMNLEAWPWGNCSIYSGARHVIGRQWMDRHWWQNDPDCLLVHDEGSTGEKKMFSGTGELGKFATDPPYGLSDEEAAFWARLVWMSGGMGMIGETIDLLKPERLALLERAFPPNDAPAWVVDYYIDPEVSVLISKQPALMVGIFNLSERPHTVRLPRKKTGLRKTTTFREWLTGETIKVTGDVMEFPTLAPRSARIWMVE